MNIGNLLITIITILQIIVLLGGAWAVIRWIQLKAKSPRDIFRNKKLFTPYSIVIYITATITITAMMVSYITCR